MLKTQSTESGTPSLDCREHLWLPISDKNSQAVCYSEVPLTGLKLEIGSDIIIENVHGWLGLNRKSGAKGGVAHPQLYAHRQKLDPQWLSAILAVLQRQ
jgi:hypothetical protein